MTALSATSSQRGIVRFSLVELAAIPWKNGGGSTREIVSWPPGAGVDGFDWRVSVATIAASGPFSVFEGVDRTIMLLDGDGVDLHTADTGLRHRLDRPLRPYAFSGDLAVDCTLLGRTSTDFNLMSRRSRGIAELRVLDSAQPPWATAHGLVMVAEGSWEVGEHRLTRGEGLWWSDLPQVMRLAPVHRGGQLIAVNWNPTKTV